MRIQTTEIVDTFAEAFKMQAARVIITGETPSWAMAAASASVRAGSVPWPRRAPPPVPDAPDDYRHLHAAIRAGLVESCHDVSDGGLAVAIGHPYPGTLAFLERAIPGLVEEGIELVPLRELIHFPR